MSQPIRVREVMTPAPHTIDTDYGIEVAREWMRNLGVRHLVVQKAGKTVGILTVAEVCAALVRPYPLSTLTVGEVMRGEPLIVSPSTPVDEVSTQMAERRLDCAIVQETDDEPLGIFTNIDALRVLSRVLKKPELKQTA